MLSTITVAAATGKASVAEGTDVEFTFTSTPPIDIDTIVKISLTDSGNFLGTRSIVSTNTVTLNPGPSQTESFKRKSC